MKPTDVLHGLTFLAACDSMRRKPGHYIKLLPPERRAILEQLKSEDAAKMRPTFGKAWGYSK